METEQLGIGNEVAFAGLFVNHHGRLRNEPIVRFGNIAAMPAEPVSAKVGDIEAYLVESRSVGGLSGSPVFVDVGHYRSVNRRLEPRPTGNMMMYLLGIMNGHWDAPKEAAAVDDGISTEYVNMGIAVVTPIDKLLKVIEQSLFGRLLNAAGNQMTGDEDEGPVTLQLQIDTDNDNQ